MGTHRSVNTSAAEHEREAHSIEIEFGPNFVGKVDARWPLVKLDGGKVYVSVPFRNVGRGLAVIVPGSIDLCGTALGPTLRQGAQRIRVPVSETTRINVICGYLVGSPIGKAEDWCLRFRYTDFVNEQVTEAKVSLQCPEGPTGPWYTADVSQESVVDPI
jgi:hypothetical protein